MKRLDHPMFRAFLFLVISVATAVVAEALIRLGGGAVIVFPVAGGIAGGLGTAILFAPSARLALSTLFSLAFGIIAICSALAGFIAASHGTPVLASLVLASTVSGIGTSVLGELRTW